MASVKTPTQRTIQARQARRVGITAVFLFIAIFPCECMDRLTEGVSHGYELIKTIETLTQGGYVPGPDVLYPTLHYLQEQALSCLNTEENGRKTIAITPISQQWLKPTAD